MPFNPGSDVCPTQVHLNLSCTLQLQVLQPLVDLDFSGVYFSEFHKLDIKGIPCYLTRTG